MSEPIRLVIADDHAPFRQAIAAVLSYEPDILIVGQGATADEAIALSRDLSPDIVLLDLDMPGGGLWAATAIKTTHPAVNIVFLTVSTEATHMRTARDIGARGYVLKGVTARELVRILHDVRAGASCWPPTMA
jgi:DNA-binding NarL/FixJ family response regulator